MKQIVLILFITIGAISSLGQTNLVQDAIIAASTPSQKGVLIGHEAAQTVEATSLATLNYYMNKTNQWMDRYNKYLSDTCLVVQYASQLFGLYLDVKDAYVAYIRLQRAIGERVKSVGDACYAPLFALAENGGVSLAKVVLTVSASVADLIKLFSFGENAPATQADRYQRLRKVRRDFRQLTGDFRTLEKQILLFDPIGQFRNLFDDDWHFRVPAKSIALARFRKWQTASIVPINSNKHVEQEQDSTKTK